MTGELLRALRRQRAGVPRLVGDRARRPRDGQRAAPAAGQAVLPRPHRDGHGGVLGGAVREHGGAAAGRAAGGAGRRAGAWSVGMWAILGFAAVVPWVVVIAQSVSARAHLRDARATGAAVRPAAALVARAGARRAGSCGARGWPGRWCSRSSPTPPAPTCCSRGCRRSSPTPAWAPTSAGAGSRCSRSSGCRRRSSRPVLTARMRNPYPLVVGFVALLGRRLPRAVARRPRRAPRCGWCCSASARGRSRCMLALIGLRIAHARDRRRRCPGWCRALGLRARGRRAGRHRPPARGDGLVARAVRSCCSAWSRSCSWRRWFACRPTMLGAEPARRCPDERVRAALGTLLR